MKNSRERIFELDAMRGICIIGMVVVHFFLNYYDFFKSGSYPAFLQFFFDWGGVLFVILSGIAVTLGHRPVKRGLAVLAAGMLCTAVTWGMDALGYNMLIIRFGILHCLAVCMLLSPLLLRLPKWSLPLLAAVTVALGFWFEALRVDSLLLFPLGLRYVGFSSGDYFPLFPYLGWFVAGIWLGKTAYKNKTTLLPKVNSARFPLSFLCACGRHSLWIYLLHQPILYVLFMLCS